jgi:undecaprenyl-diphosphatase
MKLIHAFYHFERRVFLGINQHFDKKKWNLFFRIVTQLGSAVFTIAVVLMLMIFTASQTRMTAFASAAALAFSHLPVFLLKKIFPRKRPYLVLERTKFPANPLKDHSFPSGHTTAYFSITIPFIILVPPLAIILIPAGLCVGISRMYLGLHYPSDVVAGGILGSCFGCLCFYFIFNLFQ